MMRGAVTRRTKQYEESHIPYVKKNIPYFKQYEESQLCMKGSLEFLHMIQTFLTPRYNDAGYRNSLYGIIDSPL
jgi:hypothetical protein